jgi:hypothetical protein
MWDSENGVHKVDKAVSHDSHQFAYNIGRVNQVLKEYCNKADPTTDIDDWARIRLRKVITSMVLEEPKERPTVMAAADKVDKMIVQFDEAMFGRQEAPGSNDDHPGIDPNEAMVEMQEEQSSNNYYSGMDHDKIQGAQYSSADYSGIDTDEAMVGMQGKARSNYSYRMDPTQYH